MVRTTDLRLSGRGFDPRPPHCLSVGTGISDRLRTGIPPRYITSYSSQLSRLPSVGREMGTGQSPVMRCGWRSKAGWIIPFVDKRVGGR